MLVVVETTLKLLTIDLTTVAVDVDVMTNAFVKAFNRVAVDVLVTVKYLPTLLTRLAVEVDATESVLGNALPKVLVVVLETVKAVLVIAFIAETALVDR
jgi:hypothetical protein